MNPFPLYATTSVVIFCIALHGLIRRSHLVRKIIAINLMGGSVFLFLVAVAHRNRGEIADPVPHAMVLTGIVVAVSATAFALALARRLHQESGRVTFEEEGTE